MGDWRYTASRNDRDPYNARVEQEADNLLRHFLDWGRIVRAYMYPHFRDLQKNYGPERDDPPHVRVEQEKQLLEERQKLLTRAWAAYERMEPVTEYSLGFSTHVKGLDRVGMALRTCLYTAQEMSGNPSLYRVGEALAHYLEEGLLLADVHGQNIGLDAEGEATISDPGHSVEFHPRWAEPPQIERL